MNAAYLQDVSNQFDYVSRVLGKPVARRMPIGAMKVVIAILRGDGPRPTTTKLVMQATGAAYEDVAYVVRVMKRNGWVAPVPNMADRRHKFLALSAKGSVLANELARLSNNYQSGA